MGDGSGSMEFPEFCVMMVKKMAESDTENEVREAYRVFDKDRDGFISRDELRMIFAALPERLSAEEIEEMLEAADEDGNGSINITFENLTIFICIGNGRIEYEEFKLMLGHGTMK